MWLVEISRELFEINPEAILACEGKTLEEARIILNALVNEYDEPLREAA
jgi:hypothetical protein